MAYSNKSVKKYKAYNANGIFIYVWATSWADAVAQAKKETSNRYAVDKKQRISNKSINQRNDCK